MLRQQTPGRHDHVAAYGSLRARGQQVVEPSLTPRAEPAVST